MGVPAIFTTPSTSRGRLWCIGLLLIFLGVAACSKSEETPKNSDTKTEKQDKTKQNAPGKKGNWNSEDEEANRAIPVEATRVQEGSISAYLLLSSTIETELAVDVYSELAGFVTTVHVEEGDHVQKGQVLVTLDQKEYALQEAKQLLALENQEKEYNRLKGLYERQLISNEDFNTAEYQYKQAQLNWQEAKLNLDRTEITAPIAGVISKRWVTTGQRVTTAEPLFSIVNLDEMIVRVNVPETDLAKCYVGQEVLITSDFLPGERISGTIKRISPVIDAASGTFSVTVGISDPQQRLKPGSFVNVHIITARHDAATLIPKDAVIYESDQQFVFKIVQDTLALKTPLKLGLEDAEKFEVLEGLAVGDTIIVIGQNGLKDKSKVDVVKWQDIEFEEEL